MIYFITAREIGRVKIGVSKHPHKRLRQLQMGCPPAKLKLEAVCEGDQAFEKELHRIFGPFRRHGEWFDLDASIELAIQFVRDGCPFERSQEYLGRMVEGMFNTREPLTRGGEASTHRASPQPLEAA